MQIANLDIIFYYSNNKRHKKAEAPIAKKRLCL